MAKEVVLNKFVPRDYQLPIWEALEEKGYKQIIAVLGRRAGKDLTAWNLMIRQAFKRVGVYWYVFPTYSLGKKILWTGIDSDGNSFLSYIPDELIASTNSQEMIIRLVNGSLIQIIGSDTAKDSLVGTNAVGIIFSEYALQNPLAFQYLRPIVVANNGWMIFLSTPRGKNHMYELFEIARNNPDTWFTYYKTVDDTKHIPLEKIEEDIKSGIISWDIAQQEYWCSWSTGVDGAYYTRYIDTMKLEQRIGLIPYDPSFKVHTAWDLGMRDQTTIIMFQLKHGNIFVIDCYANADLGLEHYVKKLSELSYIWGVHLAPHDIAVRELGTGMSRLERARQLGINFITVPNLSVYDGIEAVRATLPKTFIDEKKCKPLITALENYRKLFDPKVNAYRERPFHDNHSHFADAFRYLSVGYHKAVDGLTAEELDRRYQEATNKPSGGPGWTGHNWF